MPVFRFALVVEPAFPLSNRLINTFIRLVGGFRADRIPGATSNGLLPDGTR
jgi:hypothetical protein